MRARALSRCHTGSSKMLFAHYLFSNTSSSLMNQIQNDNQIKVETRCSCYDFMSRMSPRDLNSTGIYERRSKGQPPAVLAGPRYARNIQSHLKTIRLNHLRRRAESTVRFLTLDGAPFQVPWRCPGLAAKPYGCQLIIKTGSGHFPSI